MEIQSPIHYFFGRGNIIYAQSVVGKNLYFFVKIWRKTRKCVKKGEKIVFAPMVGFVGKLRKLSIYSYKFQQFVSSSHHSQAMFSTQSTEKFCFL